MSKLGASTIGNFETGKTEMSQESLEKLAVCLKTTPAELSAEIGGSAGEPAKNPFALIDSSGALDMEDQVIDEIRVRVAQFKLSSARTRQIYKSQITARLDEYDAWCEEHCGKIRESLLESARKNAQQ